MVPINPEKQSTTVRANTLFVTSLTSLSKCTQRKLPAYCTKVLSLRLVGGTMVTNFEPEEVMFDASWIGVICRSIVHAATN